MSEGMRGMLRRLNAMAEDANNYVKYDYLSSADKSRVRGLQSRGLATIGDSGNYAWITPAGRRAAAR